MHSIASQEQCVSYGLEAKDHILHPNSRSFKFLGHKERHRQDLYNESLLTMLNLIATTIIEQCMTREGGKSRPVNN